MLKDVEGQISKERTEIAQGLGFKCLWFRMCPFEMKNQ